MRPRHGRIVRWSDPARVVVQRPFYLVLLSTAVLLLVIGKANNDAAMRLRAAMTDFLSPVLIVLERPLETLGDAVDTVSDLWSLQRDNERLRRDLERLSSWQEIASRLERENAVLRAQLNLRPESRSTFVTGRIIADTGGPFVRTLIIAAGARDGRRRRPSGNGGRRSRRPRGRGGRADFAPAAAERPQQPGAGPDRRQPDAGNPGGRQQCPTKAALFAAECDSQPRRPAGDLGSRRPAAAGAPGWPRRLDFRGGDPRYPLRRLEPARIHRADPQPKRRWRRRSMARWNSRGRRDAPTAGWHAP